MSKSCSSKGAKLANFDGQWRLYCGPLLHTAKSLGPPCGRMYIVRIVTFFGVGVAYKKNQCFRCCWSLIIW